MIKYRGGAFGIQVLLRLHGSAVAKAFVPSLLSAGVYVLFYKLFDLHNEDSRMFDHPYPLGALFAAFTFLLSFKTSFSYGRYWEAVTVVYQMHSKWLDVGMELAAFHLQSKRYKQPPSFGDYPHAKSVKRERERFNEMTMSELEEQLDSMKATEESSRFGKLASMIRRRRTAQRRRPPTSSSAHHRNSINAPLHPLPPRGHRRSSPIITPLRHSRSTSIIRTLQTPRDDFDPSLLLQEGAHLISLLSAVALVTLRNDMEGAQLPLDKYEPGAPWPHEDPDAYSVDVRRGWDNPHRSLVVLRYLFGFTRTQRTRTLYNAARPLKVIGGVSDEEVAKLQTARGPLAKVALCTMWLQEFIAREHLHSGLGPIAPPIVSRLFQFTSDGMIGYNNARKIAYIPFPFPHAQITSIYVIVMVVFVPVLNLSYVNNATFGAILTFVTVLSFVGLYEVSRELEAPFKNVPNDLPLNNFQAQFNEALLTMYRGYHPDAWWVVEEVPSTKEPPALEEKEEEKGVDLPNMKSMGTKKAVIESNLVKQQTKRMSKEEIEKDTTVEELPTKSTTKAIISENLVAKKWLMSESPMETTPAETTNTTILASTIPEEPPTSSNREEIAPTTNRESMETVVSSNLTTAIVEEKRQDNVVAKKDA